MLLRVYRLTDKLGILVLKTSAAAGQWLADGVGGVVSVAGRGIGGIFNLIMQVVGLVFSLLLALGRGIGRVLRLIWRGIVRLLGFAGVSIGRTARASGSAISTSASDAMARRVARDEIDVTLKEDPLRIQNRRLSYIVIVLGIVAVSAVLWATNPDRASGIPIASSGSNDTNPFFVSAGTTPDATIEANTSGLPTVIPTATPIPDALRPRGALAYTVRERGQTDIWAVNVGSTTPIRLTNDVTDERDPEWNPDGTRLAYTSRQDGNWELYIYDVATQASSRVTFDLAFQANPSWSPDGLWLAYENYQGQNLDIFAIPIDGSSPPQNIITHPAPDFSPAWSPIDGRQIAFVSLRDGNQDIYVLDLDTVETINITNTPLVNEDHPAWSPDGRRIAYSTIEQGAETVFVKSYDDLTQPADVIAFGRTPAWSPDGVSLAYAVDAIDSSRTYLTAITYGEGGLATQVVGLPFGSTAPTWSGQILPPQLVNTGGLPLSVEPLYTELHGNQADGLVQLQPLGNVQTERPLLSDAVNDSFREMRQRVLDASGTDFLAQLDDVFWTEADRPEPGEPVRNWHMTGRAFSIPRNRILGFPPQIEIVRETGGVDIYWRVFLRVDDNSQSGQLGEPLRQMPWDFLAATEGGDVEAFNQGGRLRRDVPAGYYIDLTQLAADYGWLRQPAGTDWRANVQSRNYWLFVKNENLTWCQAILEIYLPTQIAGFNCVVGQ